VAAISGSALGVIIDARGRPLRVPDDSLARRQLLWDWLVALGAASGPLPYVADEPAPELLIPPSPSPLGGNGNITFVETTPPPPSDSPAQPAGDTSQALDHDLARLRQTVEEPKKRGLFRRK